MKPDEAFQYCEKIAKQHYENFPVGLLVPKEIRKYVYAVYTFARIADDIADNKNMNKSEKNIKLDEYENDLELAFQNTYNTPVFYALKLTADRFNIPPQMFKDLLAAFRLDINKNRHGTFKDILNYSKYSANPIGRIILIIFNIKDESLFNFSDKICTSLQLANFWQDISSDLEIDRIYIPEEYFKKYNYTIEMLYKKQFTHDYKELMKSLISETYSLFEEGKELLNHLRGRLRLELIITYYGGITILKKIESQNYNTLFNRPKISIFDKIILLIKSLQIWIFKIKI